MNPSTLTSSLVNLDYFCTDTDALSALARILKGSPLPQNVLDSIDPFLFEPEYLPDDVWYYVKCNGNVDLSYGFWKPKGGDCELASDFPFTGWRTTYEFYEGQAPNDRKTTWVMLKYWMIRSDLPGNSKEKETSSLCKVFIGDELFQNHEKFQKIKSSIVPNSEPICPNHQLVGLVPDGSNNAANGSRSKFKMSEDEIISELGFLSRGDYIELLDLDNPASPSPSSENSSCFSMSSDEYFDSDALLRDLEHDNNVDTVQRHAPCISSCAPSKLRKEVVHQGDSESLVSIRRSHSLAEENLKPDSAVLGSGYNESKLKGEASSSSHNKVVSNGEEKAVDGGKKKKKKSVGKMKKIQKKYFCFFSEF